MLRRTLATLVAVAAASFSTMAFAGPASGAASVGYVRLAHLSPDAPAVDVYLDSVSGAIDQKVFKAVGYGVVSDYMNLPTGDYTVAMRGAGSAADSPIVVSATLTVKAGQAYTVAGVGRFAGLGLKVIVDSLGRPTDGRAKLRVIHASVVDPELAISVAGDSVAQHIKFASTTRYYEVRSGSVQVKLTPEPSGEVVSKTVTLKAGSVYSVIVLDGSSGLNVVVRLDAAGPAEVPSGGVPAGAGGTSDQSLADAAKAWAPVGLGVIVLAGVLITFARRRSLPR